MELLKTALRKVRGALGNALTWGLSWAVAGIVPALVLIPFVAGSIPTLRLIGNVMLLFGVAGSVAGGVFSLVLSTVYARRRLTDLSASRVGLWCMTGTALLALAALRMLGVAGAGIESPVQLGILLTFGALGWGTAAGAVKIAQRSEGALGGGREPAALEPER